jgi:hypothetical protein
MATVTPITSFSSILLTKWNLAYKDISAMFGELRPECRRRTETLPIESRSRFAQ